MTDEHSLSISVDPEGFVKIILVNSDTEERYQQLNTFSEAIVKTIIEEEKIKNEKVRTLVDLTHLTKYSPKSIALIVGVLNKTRSHTLKTATFGARTDIELAQKAVSALAGRDNLRAFKTEHEAKMWLLAKQ